MTFYFKNVPNWSRYIDAYPKDYMVKFGLPYMIMQEWNYKVAPKLEENLPTWRKFQPHIWTTAQNDFGNKLMIAWQDPHTIFLQTTGLSTLYPVLKETSMKVQKGKLTAHEGAVEATINILKDAPKSALSSITGLANVLYTASFDILRNKDSFSGRPILTSQEEKSEIAKRNKLAAHTLKVLFPPIAAWENAKYKKEPIYRPPLVNLLGNLTGTNLAFIFKYINPEDTLRAGYWKEKAKKTAQATDDIIKYRDLEAEWYFQVKLNKYPDKIKKYEKEMEDKFMEIINKNQKRGIILTREQISALTDDDKVLNTTMNIINKKFAGVKDDEDRRRLFQIFTDFKQIQFEKEITKNPTNWFTALNTVLRKQLGGRIDPKNIENIIHNERVEEAPEGDKKE